PARRVRAIAIGPVHAGDVEVRPLGAVLDRRLQERGGLDRAALAARAVADICDLALDLVAVLRSERHRPDPVPRPGGDAAHRVDERIRLSEETDEVRA